MSIFSSMHSRTYGTPEGLFECLLVMEWNGYNIINATTIRRTAFYKSVFDWLLLFKVTKNVVPEHFN
jgi:hypothetical protein